MSIRAMLSFASDKNITKLNVDNNELDEDGARAFEEFLENNSSLQVLRASNCGLGVKSMEMMATALENNQTGVNVTQLYLSKNNVHGEGLDHLCKFICGLKQKLEVFHFEESLKEGSASLGTLLKCLRENNQNLRELNISGCATAKESLEEIKALFSYPQLRILDLSSLKLSKEALKEVSQAFLEQ